MSRISLQTPVVVLTQILSYHKEKEFSHSIKATAVAIINARAVSLVWGSSGSQPCPQAQASSQALGQWAIVTAIAQLWNDGLCTLRSKHSEAHNCSLIYADSLKVTDTLRSCSSPNVPVAQKS